MIPGNRPLRRGVTRPLTAAGGLVLAACLAACGSTTPSPVITPAPTPTPTATASAAISVAPSATPSASVIPLTIVPVPTSRFATPGPASANLTAAAAADLQKELDAIRSGRSYPGVSAAIVYPDGSIWTGQSGMAILSPQTPVTADTLFSIGSVSKTFVAATVGRLAMAGTIGLDDPLSKYLPDYPNASNISLRQMLNHTSGIKDPFADPDMAAAILANPSQPWTTAQVLSWIGKPYFAPGTGYHYSNSNFILLGQVVEKATGKSLASLVRSEFLTPLGLSHTFLQTEETVPGNKAHGYMAPAGRPRDNSAGTMIPFTAEATAFGPAGAFVSTPTDLARWATALYGGAILDQATLAAMVDISPTSPYIARPARVYGLGLEETTIAGQVAWGHLGYLDGFFSAMEYLPASHVTIVVLENADWGDPIGAAAKLAKIALGPAPTASSGP